MPATTSAEERALQKNEQVHIMDGRDVWQPAVALLDTGNEHLTCIDESYAVSLGLFDPNARPGASHAARAGTTTLRGIVPGAEASAALIFVRLRVRGVEFGPMQCALTTLDGQRPVLLGMDVLGEMFAMGFSIGAARRQLK